MAKRPRKRRFWSEDEKTRIVAQTRVPGVSVSEVARRYDVNANQVFNWIKDPRFSPQTVDAEPRADEPVFLPVEIFEEGAEPNEAGANTPSTSDVGRIEIVLPSGGRLNVTGAFDPDAVARIPGVDLIVGTDRKYKLAELVAEYETGACEGHHIDVARRPDNSSRQAPDPPSQGRARAGRRFRFAMTPIILRSRSSASWA